MEAPRPFGRYEPLFRLGAGGMAEVYVARIRGEAGFERLVAVKQMLPHLNDEPRFVEMFLDEARLAAHIQSPHVVTTLDLGRTQGGDLYLVMELVVGAPLGTLLTRALKKQRPLSTELACEIIAQAAQGLHDAHEAATPMGDPLGIVHRDVSPQNILVGADGRVRITDFGVAGAIARRSTTQPGQVKGTFAYISPEQAGGRPTDRRSDVFALGVIAWESLAGDRLFRGNNPLETLELVRAKEVPSLASRRGDVPEEVEDVIRRALHRKPDARYATASEFAVDLRRAAGIMDSAKARREIVQLVDELAQKEIAKLRERLERARAGNEEPAPSAWASSDVVPFETVTFDHPEDAAPLATSATIPDEMPAPDKELHDSRTAVSVQSSTRSAAPRSSKGILAIGALVLTVLLLLGGSLYAGSEHQDPVVTRTPEVEAPPPRLSAPVEVAQAAPSEPAAVVAPAPERPSVSSTITAPPRRLAPRRATKTRHDETREPATPSRPRRLMGLDAFDEQTRSHH